MGKKRYTEDFKRDAVKLALEGDKTQAQTAIDLGVNPQTLYQWIQKYRSDFLSSDHKLSPDEELKQLRKENARLIEEREILKKAAAYFAKHQK